MSVWLKFICPFYWWDDFNETVASILGLMYFLEAVFKHLLWINTDSVLDNSRQCHTETLQRWQNGRTAFGSTRPVPSNSLFVFAIGLMMKIYYSTKWAHVPSLKREKQRAARFCPGADFSHLVCCCFVTRVTTPEPTLTQTHDWNPLVTR